MIEDLTALSDSELMAYEKKIAHESLKYKNIQLIRKVCLNSLYGALGNEYFRFYEVRNAEAITISGQMTVRWIEKRLNIFLNEYFKTENRNYVLYIDTDSIYLHLENYLAGQPKMDLNTRADKINEFCETVIAPVIKKSYEDMADYLNVYKNCMNMKREAISEKTVFCSGKKKYIMKLLDEEGIRFQKPKLKIMGHEAIKSTTPKIGREYLRAALEIIMDSDEKDLHEYVAKCEKEFYSKPVADIAYAMSCNNLTKYTAPETSQDDSLGGPFHVKAALVHNRMVKDKKLTKKYDLIKDGDKIKILPLQMPNPAFCEHIAFTDQYPEEFGLTKYVDYEAQFAKIFITPLQRTLDGFGWTTKKRSDLSAFFTDD